MQHDVKVYTPPSGKAPDATPTTLLHASDGVIALGALDAAFARYPARVQLLLVVDAKIDERRFRDAVEAAIGGIKLTQLRQALRTPRLRGRGRSERHAPAMLLLPTDDRARPTRCVSVSARLGRWEQTCMSTTERMLCTVHNSSLPS